MECPSFLSDPTLARPAHGVPPLPSRARAGIVISMRAPQQQPTYHVTPRFAGRSLALA